MLLLRRAFVLSHIALSKSVLSSKIRPLQIAESIKFFCTQKGGVSHQKMPDPHRVVSYEDMLKVIHEPHKVIIDVREPHEVSSTGMIPSSINIPLNNVKHALVSMSEDEFAKQYRREKPSEEAEIIFYCRSGRRSTEALEQALKMGYNNSKTYLGSWDEWSDKKKR